MLEHLEQVTPPVIQTLTSQSYWLGLCDFATVAIVAARCGNCPVPLSASTYFRLLLSAGRTLGVARTAVTVGATDPTATIGISGSDAFTFTRADQTAGYLVVNCRRTLEK